VTVEAGHQRRQQVPGPTPAIKLLCRKAARESGHWPKWSRILPHHRVAQAQWKRGRGMAVERERVILDGILRK